MPHDTQMISEHGRRGFIIYAMGQSVASTGMWMQRLAIGWLAWDLTHSVAWVGAMALTEVVAALWVAPLSGVIVDRSNLFRLNLLLQGCAITVALLLFGVTMAGGMTIWLLWLLALADATWQGLSQPARMVAVGLLAGPKHMAQAIAFNSFGFNVARVTGPAVAGAIIIFASTSAVFVVNVVLFSVLIAVLWLLRAYLNQPGAIAGNGLVDDIVSGYRYIARTPAVATVFLMLLTFSLLGRPFTELFPAIAGDILGGGPATLSMLMSAQGIGGLIGGVWMLRDRPIPGIARSTFVAGIGLALALVAFCVVGSGHLAIALIAVAGACHVICNVGMQSLVQLFTVWTFRGRTMALYGLIFRVAPAASAALVGISAEWLGLAPLIAGLAVLSVVSFAVIARFGYRTIAEARPVSPPAPTDIDA